MFKVRRGGGEEIPLVQGKRNTCKTVGVARGHQRADTLKSYSQKTSQSNHTRTTALSNSMKLSHARGATQDRRVMVERSNRMWSTGEGNGKPLHYSCLVDPMNSMKRVRIKYAKFRILCSECLGIYLLASSLRRGATLWDNCHLLLLHKLKGYLFPS